MNKLNLKLDKIHVTDLHVTKNCSNSDHIKQKVKEQALPQCKKLYKFDIMVIVLRDPIRKVMYFNLLKNVCRISKASSKCC